MGWPHEVAGVLAQHCRRSVPIEERRASAFPNLGDLGRCSAHEWLTAQPRRVYPHAKRAEPAVAAAVVGTPADRCKPIARGRRPVAGGDVLDDLGSRTSQLYRYRYTVRMATERYSRHLIHMARTQAGLSQHALATRAATSQAAISAYESGRRSPSVDTLARILAAAGFELRMRLAGPDTHDRTREKAEAMLPPEAVESFAAAERSRVSATRRRASA